MTKKGMKYTAGSFPENYNLGLFKVTAKKRLLDTHVPSAITSLLNIRCD